MFKRNKSKDIDLLEQYYLATKKKNIFQEYLKYLILPLVLVFIIGGAFGYLKVIKIVIMKKNMLHCKKFKKQLII